MLSFLYLAKSKHIKHKKNENKMLTNDNVPCIIVKVSWGTRPKG